MTRMDNQILQPRPDPIPEVDLGTTLRAVRAGLRRQWRLILGVTAALVVLAAAYVFAAVPEYTARAAILLDPRIGGESADGPDARTYLLSDSLVVDSEINVLTSRELTGRLAAQMGFYGTPEANTVAPLSSDPAGPRPADAATSAATGAATAVAAASREEIRREAMSSLEVSRAGGTYVVDIAYTSTDRMLAVDLVNSLIDLYFLLDTEEHRQDNQRLADWLNQRVSVMAADVEQADRAVAEYREAHDLFTIRDDILPSQAALTAANDRLIALRTEQIDAEARLEKMAVVIASGSVSGLMDGTLGGEVATPALSDLQRRYATLQEQEAEITTRLGAESATVAANRRDQDQLREMIRQEAHQIIERLKMLQEVNLRQISATEAQVAALREQTSTDARNSIRLRELEREAALKRSLYESMLSELNTTAQRFTLERAPARVIARAVPPEQKSSPKTKRTLILALFGGLVLGSALAFLREVQDNRFRRPVDVRDGLGLPFLGVLPARAGGREQMRALRALRVAAQERQPEAVGEKRRGLVIGMTSTEPAEGAVMLADRFARELADNGARVLRLNLTQGEINGPAAGLLDLGPLLADPSAVAGIAPHDNPAEIWRISPLGEAPTLSDPGVEARLSALLSALSRRVDYIIADLPPMTEIADATVAARRMDAVILAVQWGRLPVARAADALDNLPMLRRQIVGAIYTGVRRRSYARYNDVPRETLARA